MKKSNFEKPRVIITGGSSFDLIGIYKQKAAKAFDITDIVFKTYIL